MVSYTRARAEGLGVECRVGPMQRAERFVLLFIGTLAGTSSGSSTRVIVAPSPSSPPSPISRPSRGSSTSGRPRRDRDDPQGGLNHEQDPRRHHRRRQLRLVPRPGRRNTTRTPRRTTSSPASCTSTSAATTSATSSSSAAFDIDKNKVGKDLSEAIFTTPNNTTSFSDVPHLTSRSSGA